MVQLSLPALAIQSLLPSSTDWANARGERVLFLPRWLDRETGELLSAAVGSCFLNIKRTYMELRPGLRRIYSAVMDWDAFTPILSPLGFAPLEKFSVTIGGITYHTIMNDFGPSSIDGWLAGLIGTELGVESTETREAKVYLKQAEEALESVQDETAKF